MIIKGDINGDGRITYLDAIILSLSYLKVVNLTGDAFIAADINGDGNITISDSALIVRHLLGIEIINEVIE